MTSSHETGENIEIWIYPVPASDQLYIEDLSGAGYRGQPFNMSGQQMLSFENRNGMDISGLPSGMYVLMLETVKGTTMQKIIKAGGN